MTRQEALTEAARVMPHGFTLYDLGLQEDENGNGEWVAVFTDHSDPPQVVIERWTDVYTVNDPAPEDATDETDETDTKADAEPETVSE